MKYLFVCVFLLSSICVVSSFKFKFLPKLKLAWKSKFSSLMDAFKANVFNAPSKLITKIPKSLKSLFEKALALKQSGNVTSLTKFMKKIPEKFHLGFENILSKMNKVLAPRSVWSMYKNLNNIKIKNVFDEMKKKRNFFHTLAAVKRNNELYKRGQVLSKLTINRYAHLSVKSFARKFNGFKKLKHIAIGLIKDIMKEDEYGMPILNENIPDHLDWSKLINLTVHDQQLCSSCWAFASIAALEAQLILRKNYTEISLSEQNLVDCAQSTHNMGCQRGHPVYAYQWMRNNGGINVRDSYQYDAKKQCCKYNQAANYKEPFQVKSYRHLTNITEEKLKELVARVGPVVVAINASNNRYRQYDNKIHDGECSAAPDHAVLLVGYGSSGDKENGADYWIIKNSISATWGINGYMKLLRNHNNHCGIGTDVVYPIIK